MTDWQAWHGAYEDPDSTLTRRLAVVRERLAEVLAAGGVRTVLSLCAGDGRDIVPVLASLPAERRPGTVLVELDPTLAAGARQRAAEAGVAVTVVEGDAGSTATWREHAPVDLLMLCGIFGNVTDGDVHSTVRCVPSLVRPGGAVIWTRGRFDGPDLRPQIRAWFRESGLDEVAFDSEPQGFGVGVDRRTPTTAESAEPLPERLFTFVR